MTLWRLTSRRKERLAGWLFLAPAIAYLLFAFALPIVYNLMLSFEQTSPATISASPACSCRSACTVACWATTC